MPDLRTTYLGLPLAHPVVASASPLAKSLDGVRSLEDGGAAGIVLASLFEEQIIRDNESFARYMREVRIQKPADVDAAVVEGAAARVRPLVMTVATTVLGLLPLLWESGVGADVSARTAAPVVGGLWSCMLLTLLVLPAAYAMWRRHQVRVAMAVSPSHDPVAASEGAA